MAADSPFGPELFGGSLRGALGHVAKGEAQDVEKSIESMCKKNGGMGGSV
jgi:hypothetical protein